MIDGVPTITELAEAMKKLPAAHWYAHVCVANPQPIQVLVDEPRPVRRVEDFEEPLPVFNFLSFVPTRIRHSEKGECIVWEYQGRVMTEVPT